MAQNEDWGDASDAVGAAGVVLELGLETAELFQGFGGGLVGCARGRIVFALDTLPR